MTSTTHAIASGFAASVPGAGHIRYGTPCQDASGVTLAPRPAAIVCDGRGSAKLSHFGAQWAVRAFFSQLNVLEPFLVGALDRDAPPEKWDGLCRLLYRTLMQVKLDLAAERGMDERDFDFTVAFAVAGSRSIGCFQVGDGAIVLRRDGECRTAFEPDKGEFANQTQFLRPGGEEAGKFHAALFPAVGNEGVAITSDGPEYLMFRQPDMEPGPVFGQLFDDLAKGELCEQDLRDYLTRSAWATDPRGTDDRSLVVLMPRAFGVATPCASDAVLGETKPDAADSTAQTDEAPMRQEGQALPCRERPAAVPSRETGKAPCQFGKQQQRAPAAGGGDFCRSLFLMILFFTFGLLVERHLCRDVTPDQTTKASEAIVEAPAGNSTPAMSVVHMEDPAATNAPPPAAEAVTEATNVAPPMAQAFPHEAQNNRFVLDEPNAGSSE